MVTTDICCDSQQVVCLVTSVMACDGDLQNYFDKKPFWPELKGQACCVHFELISIGPHPKNAVPAWAMGCRGSQGNMIERWDG